MALRFGMTRFPDNNTLSIPFDPATLGFNVELPQPDRPCRSSRRCAPRATIQLCRAHARRDQPDQINWKSTSANAAYSRFFGIAHHQGRRRLPQDRRSTPTCPATARAASTSTTSSPRRTASNSNATSATRSPRSCSASRRPTRATQSHVHAVDADEHVSPTTTAATRRTTGASNSKFTVNYGLRLEHETGLAEQNNNFTVGFDPTATSALSSRHDSGRPVGRHRGAAGRRRPDVRRRQRQPDHAGQPARS